MIEKTKVGALDKIVEDLKKRVENIEKRELPPHLSRILEKKVKRERHMHPRFEFDIIEEEVNQRLSEIERRLEIIEQSLPSSSCRHENTITNEIIGE